MDVAELGVAVGMLATLVHLGIGLQRVAQAMQQTQHRTRADTSKPWRTRSSASLVDDFDVQRSRDIGLPRVSGYTSSSSASSKPG